MCDPRLVSSFLVSGRVLVSAGSVPKELRKSREMQRWGLMKSPLALEAGATLLDFQWQETGTPPPSALPDSPR